MATYNTYTPEQDEWLRENAPRMSRKELAERFNAIIYFGFNCPDACQQDYLKTDESFDDISRRIWRSK